MKASDVDQQATDTKSCAACRHLVVNGDTLCRACWRRVPRPLIRAYMQEWRAVQDKKGDETRAAQRLRECIAEAKQQYATATDTERAEWQESVAHNDPQLPPANHQPAYLVKEIPPVKFTGRSDKAEMREESEAMAAMVETDGYEKTAEKFGVTSQTIRNRLAKFGLKVTPPRSNGGNRTEAPRKVVPLVPPTSKETPAVRQVFVVGNEKALCDAARARLEMIELERDALVKLLAVYESRAA
jgi:hypothetical protein